MSQNVMHELLSRLSDGRVGALSSHRIITNLTLCSARNRITRIRIKKGPEIRDASCSHPQGHFEEFCFALVASKIFDAYPFVIVMNISR